MQENVSPLPRRIGRTQQLFETAVTSGFDHLIKGDVIIKKLKNKHQYRITFSKVYGDRFFFYQVFNKDNTDNVNDQRFAAYITTKNIINAYNFYNDNNRFSNKLVFTPTTIMELPNFSKYAFVINNVYFNSNKRLVFMVSTKEIKLQNNTSKKLTQIPSGKFKHVRFDVDNGNGRDLFTVAGKKVSEMWNYINSECVKDINTTQRIFNSPLLKLCDKPMPNYPDDINDVCKDTILFKLKGNPNSECATKLKKFATSGVELPEIIRYFISNLDVDNDSEGCLIFAPP
jgi:hypothetical protein